MQIPKNVMTGSRWWSLSISCKQSLDTHISSLSHHTGSNAPGQYQSVFYLSHWQRYPETRYQTFQSYHLACTGTALSHKLKILFFSTKDFFQDNMTLLAVAILELCFQDIKEHSMKLCDVLLVLGQKLWLFRLFSNCRT